jgi:D-serine deaminase-like pyridoxal phosphate-dependent protein
MGMSLPEGLVTPALVVDRDVLGRNISRMGEASPAGGFAPLPYAESHTCARTAELQLDAGLRVVGVISGGSAPTAGEWRPGAANALRPGVGVFNDATQLARGGCGVEDLALVAAATVISVPAPGRFVLDVGSKVLGSDRSPWVTGHGYLPDFPRGTVTGLWEHHAVVRLPDGVPGPRLGSVTALVPNHVCAPVNLADELVVARRREVIGHWPVTARATRT